MVEVYLLRMQHAKKMFGGLRGLKPPWQSQIQTWGKILTYLDFWIFEIGHCIQKLWEKSQNLHLIPWNCNQLGAEEKIFVGLKPPTDYNFMLLGIDFDFFLVTFECNVRFQKFKSLNRSKFNPKSESLINIHVSPPLEQGLRMPL